jgi:mRNA interferase MazF
MPPYTTPGVPPNVPKGSIILIDFPFTDLIGEKLRPALVLYEGYLDATVACITSEIPKTLLQSDLLVSRGTPSFINTGLKKDSVILMDKIATLEKTFIRGILGEADGDLKQAVNEKIVQCLML